MAAREETPLKTRLKKPGLSRAVGEMPRLLDAVPEVGALECGAEGGANVPRMLLVRTKSAAWFLMSRGIDGAGASAACDRRSVCVVILRSALGLLLALTYTGPADAGSSILRGPAAMRGSGAASASPLASYLLCTEGTGRPRSSTDGPSALSA